MEIHEIEEKRPALKIFAIICNFILLAFTIFFWVDDGYISDEEFMIYSGLSGLSTLNIFVLWRYSDQILEKCPGIIGLYFRRRRIEEEYRIKELENKIKSELR